MKNSSLMCAALLAAALAGAASTETASAAGRGFGTDEAVAISSSSIAKEVERPVAMTVDRRTRKILLLVEARHADGRPVIRLARLARNGVLDRRFGRRGWVTFPRGLTGGAVISRLNGRIVVTLTVLSAMSEGGEQQIFQLRSDGSRDRGWGNRGLVSWVSGDRGFVQAVLPQGSGRLVIHGVRPALHDEDPVVSEYLVTRLLKDGSPDTSFGPRGSRPSAVPVGSSTRVHSMAPSRGFLAITPKPPIATANGCEIRKILPTGELDTTFYGGLAELPISPGTCGAVATDSGGVVHVTGVPIGGDSRLVVATFPGSGIEARVRTYPSPAGAGGAVQAVVPLGDGRVATFGTYALALPPAILLPVGADPPATQWDSSMFGFLLDIHGEPDTIAGAGGVYLRKFGKRSVTGQLALRAADGLIVAGTITRPGTGGDVVLFRVRHESWPEPGSHGRPPPG